MNIYVGNLSFEVNDNDLKNAFSACGRVRSAKVITDNMTGKSRGFGFVEMEEKSEGEAAIAKLNGTDLKGRAITVNEARPRANNDRGDRGGRGGYGGGEGGGRRDFRGGQGGGGRKNW